MIKTLVATHVLAALATAGNAQAADVGVSVQISQPGVYGRMDIGRFPQPQLVVAQPVVIQRPVQLVQQAQPVYMWVPPGHRKNWRAHCSGYNACGAPVYFVQDQWYDQHVQPHGHGKHKDKSKGQDKHEGKHASKHGSEGKGNGKHGD